MAAQNTDKWKKLARRWVGQIGAGGVSDAVTTTVPLSSATNLPTDTAVVVVIDRVDANGTSTSSLEETVIGIVSGSSLVSCVRGAEGTAQAHNAGAVVEVLVTAKGWNDFVDGLLVAFNQNGTIKDSAVLTTPQINDTSKDHRYVVSVCELTADRIVALPLLTAGDEFVFKAHTQTLTNKRITKRILSAASYTTDTGTSLNCDNLDTFIVTAQAGALKFNNPTGTPTDGQTLWIAVTGTAARALTYDTQFEASAGVSLPTTTVTTARLDIGFVWRADTSKWHCVASA